MHIYTWRVREGCRQVLLRPGLLPLSSGTLWQERGEFPDHCWLLGRRRLPLRSVAVWLIPAGLRIRDPGEFDFLLPKLVPWGIYQHSGFPAAEILSAGRFSKKNCRLDIRLLTFILPSYDIKKHANKMPITICYHQVFINLKKLFHTTKSERQYSL